MFSSSVIISKGTNCERFAELQYRSNTVNDRIVSDGRIVWTAKFAKWENLIRMMGKNAVYKKNPVLSMRVPCGESNPETRI